MNKALSQKVTTAAEKALLYEVSLSPKPGLVDRLSNGAHQDMDFYLFVDSVLALAPFFNDYLTAGLVHHGTPMELFTELRRIGQQAETAMFKATNGVNTHKGANFSLAVILGATGLHLQTHSLPLTAKDSEKILQLSADLTRDLIENDFKNVAKKSELTHGEKLYLEKGIIGIRGEAAQGYPALGQLLLPFLRQNRKLPKEELLLRAMLLLMSEIEDGNILHRGGYEAWQQVKNETRQFHLDQLGPEELIAALTDYDRLLIQRNLSPGGTADLLALGIYFALLEEIF